MLRPSAALRIYANSNEKQTPMTTAPPQQSESGDEIARLRERIARLREDAAMPRETIAVLERQLAALIAERLPAAIADLPLAELPGLNDPVATVSLDGLTSDAAEQARRQQPGERLVTLDADGLPLGIIEQDPGLDIAVLPPDPFAAAFAPPVDFPLPPDSFAEPRADIEESAESFESRSESGERVLIIQLEGLAPGRQLTPGNTYELRCSIAAPRLSEATSWISASSLEIVEEMEVDLYLFGNPAVEIREPASQTLRLARDAEREAPAVSFAIAPSDERATLTLALALRGRIFQTARISLESDGITNIRLSGETIDAALERERTVRYDAIHGNLLIVEAESRGYELILITRGLPPWRATIAAGRVEEALNRVREALYKITRRSNAGEYMYRQFNTEIPAEIHAESLRELARLGRYLFDSLFGADDTELIRRLKQGRSLRLRVVAERFVYPWSLIYSGDDLRRPDPDGFWGIQHHIEQPIAFAAPEPLAITPLMPGDALTQLGLAADPALDEQLGMPVVAGMRERLGMFAPEEAHTPDQLLRMLVGGEGAPSVVCIVCPAGGGNEPAVVFGNQPMRIRELMAAPSMKSGQLLLLNIVESAEMIPALYADLTSFLARRGAYGLVGNLFELPAPFAAEFSAELLRRFAGGMPLGEALRDLRREYLSKKNNILGLLYELYADADTTVAIEVA